MTDGQMSTIALEEARIPRRRPAWLEMLSSRDGRFGFSLIIAMLALIVLGPFLAPYAPTEIRLAPANQGPSVRHWLGTDHLGRDILSRVLWGARTVLTVAPIAVLGATAFGSLVGLAAGYYRGWIDLVITRLSDIVLSFPVIILYMIILAIYGSSAFNIIAVITLTKAPIIARIVRGITLELREREYVAAAKMRAQPGKPKLLEFVDHSLLSIDRPSRMLRNGTLVP